MPSMKLLVPRAALAIGLVIASFAATAQSVALGPGDVVSVSVFGQDNLDKTARIDDDGDISFPLIERVTIGGLTTTEAAREIADQLARGNFVRNPQVSVFLQERRTTERDSVTILGQVRRPGRFAVDPLTGESAQTVIGLLALAGGLADDSADSLVLTRQTSSGGERVEIDLVALLRDGDLSQNYVLMAGDIVFVPRMDVFYVYGEVNNPGRFRLERNMTVMQAISVSGGLTSRASEKGLQLRRRLESGKIESRNVETTDIMQREDVLYVREGLF